MASQFLILRQNSVGVSGGCCDLREHDIENRMSFITPLSSVVYAEKSRKRKAPFNKSDVSFP